MTRTTVWAVIDPKGEIEAANDEKPDTQSNHYTVIQSERDDDMLFVPAQEYVLEFPHMADVILDTIDCESVDDLEADTSVVFRQGESE
jgi:hypothetical protein